MKRLLTATALGLCLFATAPTGSAQVLNVQNADIRAFIQDVSRVTGRTFIIDPRVRGTVSVVSDERLSKEEFFQVLLSTLRANGLVAVQLPDGAYRIAPEEGAAQTAASGGGVAGFGTEVFRLRNISAAAAVESLKPLVGRQGVISASPQGNRLIVSDYADNLRRIRGLIAQVDQDGADTQTVTMRHTSAREIAAVLNGILNPPGVAENTRNALVTVVVVESSNSLLLRGDPATVSRLLPIIADLDRRAESSDDIRVVRLQHADAEEMLPVLQQIVGATVTPPQPAVSSRTTRSTSREDPGGALRGQPPQPQPTQAAAPPAEAGPSGPRANIARYPGANALVIAADPETQRILADVIRQLDVRREQVLIEAIVVEISDNAAKELGVQLLLAGTNSSAPFAVANYSNQAPNILGVAGAVAGERNPSGAGGGLREIAINSILGGAGLLGGGAAAIDDDVLFGFIINAVKRDASSNLLQTPSVLTLDNKEATILVGQEVPITTGEVLGNANTNPFRTIQRQNVGVQLDVRPQINAGGGITLFLRQEVSSIAQSTAVSGELILDKREVETTALADDGEIIVIGGLLDQNEVIADEKVPVLGDIPVLGNLFKNRTRQRGKRNLMIFIRPTIVRTREGARNLTGGRYDYIRSEQYRAEQTGGAAPGSNPSLDALVRDYLRANPPVSGPPAVPGALAPTPAPVQSAPLPPLPPVPSGAPSNASSGAPR